VVALLPGVIAGVVFIAAFPKHEAWVWVLGVCLLLITSCALLRTGCGDPGLLPLHRVPVVDGVRGPPPTSPATGSGQWTTYAKAGGEELPRSCLLRPMHIIRRDSQLASSCRR
jgi:hypothetical protein